jgi:5-dehydro-2-deoxygluconokinase
LESQPVLGSVFPGARCGNGTPLRDWQLLTDSDVFPLTIPADLDVIVVGRAAIDLYAEQVGRPLEEVESFRRYLGGCAGNIAVGTARLGLKSAILTRVGDEALGTFVTRFLSSEGVDVSQVRRDSKHHTGLVILGIDPPKNFPLLFFREGCADIELKPDDVDPAFLRRAKAIVLTGTGLSKEPSRSANLRIAELAKSSGVRLALDLDYRPTLWPGRDVACQSLQAVIGSADLVVGTEEEFHVAGGSDDVDLAVRAVREAAPGIVVVKRGERGCDVFPAPGDEPIHGRPYEVKVLNVLGAGDGFMSGFLYGWVRGWDPHRTARFANAIGAIVVTRHGCAPAMPYYREVESFFEDQGGM